MNRQQLFLCIDEPFLFVQSEKSHYLWSKERFNRLRSNENRENFFFMIVPTFCQWYPSMITCIEQIHGSEYFGHEIAILALAREYLLIKKLLRDLI